MVRSGSYYGATSTGGPTEEDLAQAESLGRRTARYARWLKLGLVHRAERKFHVPVIHVVTEAAVQARR